jgi:UDP-hydrolysing UDP-N-acetyl-D-glucosamine 2-epimerase
MAEGVTICVVSSGRADYGLIRPILDALRDDPRTVGQLLLTGTHADRRFGSEADSLIEADALVPMPLDGDDAAAAARGAAAVLTGVVEALGRLAPDAVLIVGDRYEILAVAQAAMLLRLPLIHLGGGDVTEGAIDEGIRHAVSKLAQLHLVTHAGAAHRLRQLGEEDWRIHTVGNPSLDSLAAAATLPDAALEGLLGRPLAPDNLLVCFHPVTLLPDGGRAEIDALLAALGELPASTHLWITRPNADPGHEALTGHLTDWAAGRSNASVHATLGPAYLPLMARCRAVVGNSSSGLTEAPSLGIPTVNVGVRQQGRLAGETVFHCAGEAGAIRAALARAMAADLADAINPYGDGKTVPRILSVLTSLPERDTLMHKRFIDIEVAGG